MNILRAKLRYFIETTKFFAIKIAKSTLSHVLFSATEQIHAVVVLSHRLG